MVIITEAKQEHVQYDMSHPMPCAKVLAASSDSGQPKNI